MKTTLCSLFLVGMLWMVSCGGDSEEDIKTDCANSTLQILEVSTTNANCSANGSLEVSSSGASGSVQYNLDGGAFQSSGIFSVSAGTYTVSAKDDLGCTSSIIVTVSADANTVTISDITSTDSGCGTSSASIEVTASGGTGSLMYKLDDGSYQSSNTFTGISSGTYQISVKDSEDCTATRSEHVLSGTSLNDDIQPILDANCAISGCHNGDNGSDKNWTVKDNVLAKASLIKTRTQNGSMPQGSATLTQMEIDLIACWVDDGALDN